MYNSNMNIFIREKPRQQGKTKDLLELLVLLLTLGRKIVFVVTGGTRELQVFKKNHKTVLDLLNEYYKDSVIFVSVKSIDMVLRGHRFDTILIDDYDVLSYDDINKIKTVCIHIPHIHIYITKSPTQ